MKLQEQRGRRREGQYLVQDVVAFLSGGDLDEAVEALCSLLDKNVPASGVVPLTTETHHLTNTPTVIRLRPRGVNRLYSGKEKSWAPAPLNFLSK